MARRPVLLLSMLLYVLSSIGAGLSTSLGMLILFRFLQGLTAGAGSVIGRAIVGDLFSGAEAQRVMSYISVVFGLAPAIAPILGGWLLALLWLALDLRVHRRVQRTAPAAVHALAARNSAGGEAPPFSLPPRVAKLPARRLLRAFHAERSQHRFLPSGAS
ncbi:MAG: MFS transporter [Chthoniobacter sp.]